MASSRRPRTTPPGTRPGPVPELDDAPSGGVRRPSVERAKLEAETRSTRRIAVGALVVALIGLGLAAWRVFAPGGGAACQTAAWDTAPDAGDLPAGWTISASQYGVNVKFMRFLGPLPSDTTTSQASTDATISCFPEGAADSVTKTAEAITAAGETVTQRNDLGDQAFSAVDGSGDTLLQLRHGDLVVYLAGSGATPDEVDILASAFDLAMGGSGGNVPIGTLDAGSSTGAGPSEGASEEPSDQAFESDVPVDPALEAALPTVVGDVQLTVGSETGDSFLSDDQFSRAIIAALRAAGKQPTDLHLAYAYDAVGDSDLQLNVFAVDGMSLSSVRQFVLDTWLSASGAGITREKVTMSGVEVTRVDYGDGQALDYVLTRNGRVFVVTTSDASLAEQAIAALP
jgi:hypothetical protein